MSDSELSSSTGYVLAQLAKELDDDELSEKSVWRSFLQEFEVLTKCAIGGLSRFTELYVESVRDDDHILEHIVSKDLEIGRVIDVDTWQDHAKSNPQSHMGLIARGF